jgi:DNA-binding response OmpR family regulator
MEGICAMIQLNQDTDVPLILLVEDHTPLLRNMTFLLEVAGYAVVTATDGAQALEILQNQLPDLIVSDIEMPNKDGYELLRQVRAKKTWNSIPFIFMSDKYSYEEFLFGLDLGADHYIPKPFDFYDLLFAIEEVLPEPIVSRFKDSA